jgi:hypothetical protein
MGLAWAAWGRMPHGDKPTQGTGPLLVALLDVSYDTAAAAATTTRRALHFF